MVQMLKKISFYVFILASIIVAIWGYFRLKDSKEPNVSVLDHIPINTACMIETKNYSELVTQLTRQNLIWNSLLTNESMQVAQNGIRYLDSLVNSKSDIASVIDNNTVYWSFIKQTNTTEHLILFKVKEKNNEDLFLEFFKTVFSKEASVSSAQVYSFTNNRKKWFLTFKDGLVYVCSNLSLLQNSIELKKENSMSTNKDYINLLKLEGEQKSQVYFNHAFIKLLPEKLFSKQSLFGIEVQLNEITLTGYSNADSLSLLNCIKNQHSEKIIGFEHLPNQPLCIKGITLSDPNLFYKNIQQQFSSKRNQQNNEAWNTLNDSALYNIKQESFENLDREILEANYVIENTNQKIVSLKINDSEKSEGLLKFMSDSVFNSNDSKIYKLNTSLSQVFEFTEQDLKNQYAMISDGYLLFFSSKMMLDYYQTCFNSSQLLGKNLAFMDYANDNLMLACNYLYYENSELLKKYDYPSFIECQELANAKNATAQVSFIAKKYKNSIQVRINASHAQPKSDGNSELSNILWTFNADSLIQTKVHLFINHLTQENELCFQDESFNLYLINSTGNLLFKTKMNEAIQSEIFTVDIFKNGKLQLLFNTENYLHLIDRNGNEVQGFPVKTPSRVTSPLTVLDYDGNKDYRLFLACTDKRIYNFSLYGIKTEGFIPLKTEQIVTLPIYYVSVGASDYLITADVSGKIYAFSRKGVGRIDFKNKTIEQLKHLYVLGGNSLDNTKLIYVDDKNNLLNKISLNDQKEALKIGDELSGFKTSFDLVNDDNQSDVLVYGNGALYGYDLFTSKLVEYFNELAVYDDVQLIHTSDTDWFLAYDKTGKKIDIINMSGKLASSMQGATQKPCVSDLYKNGKTYVLLVNGNKVSCQQLK